MIDVVVLSCKLNNCVYYVSPNNIDLSYNDEVVFEDNGDYLVGTVIKTKYGEKKENLFLPLSNVVRLVTKDDLKKLKSNEELIEGLKRYIGWARSYGYKVYVGTLLPMGGWRTDAPFRQEIRHAYNEFIRTTDLIDGYIDFDKAMQNGEGSDYLIPEYDSGDHLHPGEKGHEKMAETVPVELLK